MEQQAAKLTETIVAGNEISAIVAELIEGAENITPIHVSYSLIVAGWNTLKLLEGEESAGRFVSLLRDLADDIESAVLATG